MHRAATIFASVFMAAATVACSSTPKNTPTNDDGGGTPGVDGGGSTVEDAAASGNDAANGGADASHISTPDGGGGVHPDSGGTNDAGTSGGGDGSAPGSGGPPFAAGTICNASGTPRTPPTTLKNLIVILLENTNFDSVNGAPTSAPYINSLASACGVATAYNDNCFSTYFESLPHYLALTSGSNCNTGLGVSGSGCILVDQDATSGTLSTTSIFGQVTSWKSYQEAMPSACDMSTPSTPANSYACKHNPPPYYSNLSTCSTYDLGIANIVCDTNNTMTACSPTPSNAFTEDLANDTLAEFTFVTPTLLNDMHTGTIQEADNWLYTYVPLILNSAAYLRGDVGLFLIWDQQAGTTINGPIPNVFISPYITAGSTSATPFNHFAVLRAWENALGISTYLGCASGTQPGDAGTCPAGSTVDVRSLMNF